MDIDRKIQIDRSTLEALLHRAQREVPRSPEERRAEEDVREALSRDFQDAFPVEAEQLSLFDTAPYEIERANPEDDQAVEIANR